jgi:predicted nucleotide-binding protein (sugar kinase/HSP70/actin superfamily)
MEATTTTKYNDIEETVSPCPEIALVDDKSSSAGETNDSSRVTLLFNGLTWKHDRLMEGMFESLDLKCKALPTPNVEAFQLGKEFGNNGQCNPTYFTVGNLVKYLRDLEAHGLSRKEITDQYAFFTLGGSGPCRFGMYVEEYRLALRNAGFPDFRVEFMDFEGGLNPDGETSLVTADMDTVFGLLNTFCLGDIIISIGNQIRPFEINPGETNRVMNECIEYLYEFMRNRPPCEMKRFPEFLKKRLPGLHGAMRYLRKFIYQLRETGFEKALEHCRDRFDSIKIDRTRAKPIVKIQGEFWAQTTEGDGNFNMFSFLEKEGSQCHAEPVAKWVPYLLFLAQQKADANRTSHGLSSDFWIQTLKRKIRMQWEYAMTTMQLKLGSLIFIREYDRLAKVFGDLSTYMIDQDKLNDLGQPFYDTRVEGGEGFLEVAKAIYYTKESKAHMILSLKPFGCMPSTQSDGAMAQVVSKYKDMIFLPIETSGEGEVNAHSRVQMALGEAKHKTKAEFSQVLEQSGYTLEQIRSYISNYRELETPMYPVPHYKGVVGTAANFVRHVAERMKQDGIGKEKVAA